MKIDKSKWLPAAAIAASLGCLFQIAGLIRYLGRLPQDWIGITLYSASIIAFAVAALGFYIQWRRR